MAKAAHFRWRKIILPPLHHWQAELRVGRKRFSVEVCHRRFGKTFGLVHYLMERALTSKQQAYRAAYLAPYRQQAKDIAWDMLKRFAKDVPGVTINESELRLDFFHNAARIQLLGADNPDALRGRYLDDVVLDEYAQMRPTLWPEIIRPTLSDRRGRAIFCGTPKGRNDFYERFQYAQAANDPEWSYAEMPVSLTKIIADSELQSARQTMTDEQYRQEYECSFTAAVMGAYYGREMEQCEADGRLTTVPYLTQYPVDTYWDLGVSKAHDTNAVWFVQQVGLGVHVIDYHQAMAQGIDYFVKMLRDKGYVYRRHATRASDLETTDWGTGKTRLEQAAALGLRFVPVQDLPLIEGISAVRQLLPRVRFDAARCAQGLEALRWYQHTYDSTRKVYLDQPLHDWASHGADAFRYLAIGVTMAWDGERSKAPVRASRPAVHWAG